MTPPSTYKEDFYTLMKKNFLNSLVGAEISIDENLTEPFIGVLLSCLDTALTNTFNEMKKSLEKQKEDECTPENP